MLSGFHQGNEMKRIFNEELRIEGSLCSAEAFPKASGRSWKGWRQRGKFGGGSTEQIRKLIDLFVLFSKQVLGTYSRPEI